MRRTIAGLAALALVAGGCTLSRLDQAAAVTVHGTLLAPDGSPLADAEVLLFKDADLGDALFGFALVAGTLGTICLVDDPPALCRGARRATTGADGRFTYSLRGRDTQGLAGTAADFSLTAGLPAGEGEARGPLVTARFKVQATDLELPDLRFWRPRLALSVSGGQGRAQWPEDRGDEDRGDATVVPRVVFFGGPAAAIVWAVDGGSPSTFDARVLEDSVGTAAVEVASSAKREGTTVRITRRSGPVPYSGSAGAPPSRGAVCTGTGSAEDSLPAAFVPCPVTDGDLGPPARSPAPGPVTTATLDLGSPLSVGLVVVRDCPPGCRIETSVDGQEWVAVPAEGDGFVAARPPEGTTARTVRVRAVSDLGRLGEVSVW